jgi:hypothetical protein
LGKHRAERQPINWRIVRVHWAYKTLRIRRAFYNFLFKVSR